MKRLVIVLTFAAMLTSAMPVAAKTPSEGVRSFSDNLPGPLAIRQQEMRNAALQGVLRGELRASGPNMVVNLAEGDGPDHRPRGGKYVELAFEGEDQILTLLAQFGTLQATHNHGAFGIIDHGGAPGPLHNQIPEPDRTVDNTTIWSSDFSQAYYKTLLYDKNTYPSMANYYLEQSSGQYSVNGHVTGWVQNPYNAAAYGSNYCGSIVCTRDIGRFVEDQVDGWWPTLISTQGSVAAANLFLAKYDIWDRYDFDGDGNFDEPDGYIDHFQSVHAGEGEETGGGAQGEDAIWSHRAFVNSVPFGGGGPPGGPAYGGAQIGDSNYWIGDYTIEPENGGVGVFSHEFAHDLGLPDLYDTSGNTGGAENSTAWWTIMSQGSYGTQTFDLGSAPVHFGAWEKLQLGFLENFTIATNTSQGRFVLGPAAYNTARPQAMFVVLPNKELTTTIWEPWAGDWMYYSGSGNDLHNDMTREVTLGAGPIAASFKAKYHIEPCWDYAYLQVSTDGTTWTNVHTSASAGPLFNANGLDQGEGITGISGTPLACDDDLSPAPDWVDVTADLSAWASSTVWLRFSYVSDGAVAGVGFSLDDLSITGMATDGAETDPGWTYNGFLRIDGEVTDEFFNAYVIENRQYIGYDDSLNTGPYNFGFPTAPNFVEHFRNQNGLLISYWDDSFADNNVGEHPGGGLILPIDSHPEINTWSDDGTQMRPRLNSYDSTFTRQATDSITVHNPATGEPTTLPSLPGVRVFDDSVSYWRASHPADAPLGGRYQAGWNSVIVPNTGFVLKIKWLTPLRVILKLNP